MFLFVLNFCCCWCYCCCIGLTFPNVFNASWSDLLLLSHFFSFSFVLHIFRMSSCSYILNSTCALSIYSHLSVFFCVFMSFLGLLNERLARRNQFGLVLYDIVHICVEWVYAFRQFFAIICRVCFLYMSVCVYAQRLIIRFSSVGYIILWLVDKLTDWMLNCFHFFIFFSLNFCLASFSFWIRSTHIQTKSTICCVVRFARSWLWFL